MSDKTIQTLKITNYKSIDSLELKGLAPFSVFAGPNGSGKSNFFDALNFVSLFIQSGIEIAQRAHGGFNNFHSEKRRKEKSRKFTFEIECSLENPDNDNPSREIYHYNLNIYDLDKHPKIEERLSIDEKTILNRKKDGNPEIIRNTKENISIESFPKTYSALLLFSGNPIVNFLRNMSLYRIDPIGAKEPDQSDSDPSKLDKKGHNLASVLRRLESNEQHKQTILDWMATIVPGLEKILTEQQQLESKTAILFKEKNTRRRFPAHMISDGTVYALSLLVAVLDRPENFGLTTIEEPERGLHPTAIQELIALIRDQATANQPIWMTTHSESVVRQLRLEELVLVNKPGGRTRMKIADAGNLSNENLAPLGLDEAWLSNLLDGGTPTAVPVK